MNSIKDITSSALANFSPRLLTSNLLKQELAKSLIKAPTEESCGDPTEGLSVRAVSRAIAQSQYRRYGVEVAPEKYKDRVQRALTGTSLSPDTLHLFAEAFDFSEDALNKLLAQLGEESALASTSLAWLFEFPQVSLLSAFINVDIFTESTKSHFITFTATFAALEQGASSCVIYMPDSTGHVEIQEGCTAVKITEEGHWLVTFDYPLRPLMHTIIRLSFEIAASEDKNFIEVPLWGKYYSVGLCIKAPYPAYHVEFFAQEMVAKSTNLMLDGVYNQGTYSVYCPTLENAILRATWTQAISV